MRMEWDDGEWRGTVGVALQALWIGGVVSGKQWCFEGWTWTLHVLCKARALIAFWATMSMPGCINPLVQVGGTVLILLSSHERHCSTLGKVIQNLYVYLRLSQNMTGLSGFFQAFQIPRSWSPDSYLAPFKYLVPSAGLGAGDFSATVWSVITLCCRSWTAAGAADRPKIIQCEARAWKRGRF